MKKGIALTVSVATMLAASVAVAKDKAPSWDGFYTSALVGYTYGEVGERRGEMTMTGGYVALLDTDPHAGGSSSGLNGTLAFGFNKTFGNVLTGLELAGTLQNAHANSSALTSYYDSVHHYSFNDDPSWLRAKTSVTTFGTLAARLGHIFDPSTLGYVKGGLALGKTKRTITQTLNYTDMYYDAGVPNSDTRTDGGYVVGIGFERKLTENLALKAEYQYVDFGAIKFTNTAPFTASDNLNTFRQSISVRLSTVSFGVSYQY